MSTRTVQGPTDLVLILVDAIQAELAKNAPDAEKLGAMRKAATAAALLCHIPDDDMSCWG